MVLAPSGNELQRAKLYGFVPSLPRIETPQTKAAPMDAVQYGAIYPELYVACEVCAGS